MKTTTLTALTFGASVAVLGLILHSVYLYMAGFIGCQLILSIPEFDVKCRQTLFALRSALIDSLFE